MPKISDMKDSKFLRQTDVGAGMLCTVQGVEQQNTAKEGAEPHMKWVLLVEESDKPLVLNQTNIQLCAKIFGSEDTDQWTGKRVVLYVDPSVMYAGEMKGGIRVRAPKGKAAQAPPPPKPAMVSEDEIPFAWVMPLIAPIAGTLLALHTLTV